MTAEEWAEKVIAADRATQAKVLIDAKAMRMQDLNAMLASPTSYQPQGGQRILHEHPGWGAPIRVKIGAGGHRSGKSRWLAREVTHPAITIPRARIWIIGADYDLPREEFNYLMEDVSALGYPTWDRADLSTPKAGRWMVTLSNGSVVETQTAEDLRKIEAANITVIALVEAGSLTEDLFKAARGRVLEAAARGEGGQVLMSGRHRGSFNWYTNLWRTGRTANPSGIVSASLRSWDNAAVFRPCDPATCTLVTSWPPPTEANPTPPPLHGGFHNPEIQDRLNNLSEDEFGEMAAAEPRPDRSLVLADWFDHESHVVPMDFEDRKDAVAVVDAGRKIIGWRLPKDAPVECWIDPGHRGAYAVLARQKHGDDILVIDEIYLKGQNTSHVIDVVKTRWWYPQFKSAVVDVATKWETESWWQKECNVWPRGQKIAIADGIERIRSFLRDPATKRPRIWFNAGPMGGSCPYSVWEAEAGWRYHTARNEQDPRGDKEEPIDTNNHAMNALAYGLIDNFGVSPFYEQSGPVTLGYDGRKYRP